MKPLILLVGLAIGLSVLTGCDGIPDTSSEKPDLNQEIVAPSVELPSATCHYPASDTFPLHQVAHRPAPPIVADSTNSWIPDQLKDVVSFQRQLIFLDHRTAELVRLSRDLELTDMWGGKGGGPSEFRSPVALTLGPAQDTLWVLEEDPPSVVGLNEHGKYQRSVRLDHGGADLAVDPEGRFVVASEVIGPKLRAFPSTTDTVVRVYSKNGEHLKNLLVMNADSLGTPRYPLAGPMDIAVHAVDTGVVVSVPTSGFLVHFDRSLKRTRESRVCLTEELKSAYLAQYREIVENDLRVQSVRSLLSDVTSDNGDALRVLSGVPTEDGFIHLDHLPLGRGERSSVLLKPTGEAFPPGFLQLLSGNRVISFKASGGLRLYKWASTR